MTARFPPYGVSLPAGGCFRYWHAFRRVERDGLIVREVGSEVPSRVVYRATSRVQTLDQPLRGLLAWTKTYRDAVATSRFRWDNGLRSNTVQLEISSAMAWAQSRPVTSVAPVGKAPSWAIEHQRVDAMLTTEVIPNLVDYEVGCLGVQRGPGSAMVGLQVEDPRFEGLFV